MKAEELDEVVLKNGIKGIIVGIYKGTDAFVLERPIKGDNPEFIDATFDDIAEVTWRFSEHLTDEEIKKYHLE